MTCPGCGRGLDYSDSIETTEARKCPSCLTRIKLSMPLGNPKKAQWLNVEAALAKAEGK